MDNSEKDKSASLATPAVPDGWRAIDSAPKGPVILLGYFNPNGHWRTMRGQWLNELFDQYEELREDFDGGWCEVSCMADDIPNAWECNPTHWQPLPAAPKQDESVE